MALDPVKIPQNVYIEDRIVGPLTLRQTLIMAAGGGFSYAMYAMLTKSLGQLSAVATIIVWLPAALSALFAIVRVNDMSLVKICLLLIERMQKQPVRTFAPRQGISIVIRTSSAVQSAQERKKQEEERLKLEQAERRTQEKIRELSSVVDEGDRMTDGTDAPPSVPARVDPSRISVDRSSKDVPSLADLTADDFKLL